MKTYDLKSIQKRGLAILLDVDKVCAEHKIQYFLDGGTLIGAVRHKGFIPWDDDIDLSMPRDDYESIYFEGICSLLRSPVHPAKHEPNRLPL